LTEKELYRGGKTKGLLTPFGGIIILKLPKVKNAYFLCAWYFPFDPSTL